MAKAIATSAAALVCALSSSPAWAQYGQTEAATVSAENPLEAIFGKAFEARPLTADEQAALPQAEAVIEQIFPAGTYARMMDKTLKPMMDGMMGGMLDMPLEQLARLTGLPQDKVAEAGSGTLAEAMAVFDPAFRERQQISMDVTVDFIRALMDRVEPSYRAGLAKAYAQRFSAAELAELHRFFDTPTGSHYAAESMLIYSDPQVMAAMKDMLPAMFELMPQMMEQIETRTAHLPQPRDYSDLDEAERNRLATLLLVDRTELDDSASAGDEEDYGGDAAGDDDDW